MLKHNGQKVERLYIWFLDGLAIAANPDSDKLLSETVKLSTFIGNKSGMIYDWFSIGVVVEDNEPARLWRAHIVAPSFSDNYICRMVADYWCSQTTNKAYWKSWWVEVKTGDRYNHEFTCHKEVDAASHFLLNHPEEEIVSISGKDRVYLDANIRRMIDAEPFSTNQPISSLLQFEHLS
jgi:hypothetical protein